MNEDKTSETPESLTPRTDAVWADIQFFDPKLPAHSRQLERELNTATAELLRLQTSQSIDSNVNTENVAVIAKSQAAEIDEVRTSLLNSESRNTCLRISLQAISEVGQPYTGEGHAECIRLATNALKETEL